MLARSGVKKIRIIDFDRVSLSSLNRHSYAVREDVGTPKVECIKKYVKKIFPHIIIETV
jgi:tRNA A37 threonylcarbamoyladenosine dehydratase